MIPAGKRWHAILIEQPTETQDSRGVPVPAWTTFASPFASYEELRGEEVIAAGQPFATDLARWGLLPIPGVTAKMRINEGGVLFDILQIDTTKVRQGELWLTTKRRSL